MNAQRWASVSSFEWCERARLDWDLMSEQAKRAVVECALAEQACALAEQACNAAYNKAARLVDRGKL